MKRTAPRERARKEQRRVDKAELDAAFKALRDGTCTGIAYWDSPSDRTTPSLAEANVDIRPGGAVLVGGRPLGMLQALPGGRSKVVLGPAFPRMAHIRSPTWLELVRLLPCAVPGCKRPGRPFYEQLQMRVSQSEANHYPSRGRSAGGNDLETHPACPACHARITANQVDEECLVEAVAGTLRTIIVAVREGRIATETLLAVAVEMTVNA